MKKIGLLLMLIVGLVRAEVLCTLDNVGWDSTTTQWYRDTVGYTGNSWTGLVEATIVWADNTGGDSSSLVALNDIYESMPYDVDYLIYFASDSSQCTHTLENAPSLAGGVSGKNPIASVHTAAVRTRALSSVSRLTALNRIETSEKEESEGEESEEKEESVLEKSDKEPKVSFSVGLATSMSDDVSIFENNTIPIYAYIGDLMVTFIHSDISTVFGVGSSNIEGNSEIREWGINYASLDFNDIYSIMLHSASIGNEGKIIDLSFNGDIIITPDAIDDTWTGLDYSGNIMVFDPIKDDLYFQYGLYAGWNIIDSASAITYGGLIGLLYMSNGLVYSADFGYYTGSYNPDSTSPESTWTDIDSSTVLNFAINYDF